MLFSFDVPRISEEYLYQKIVSIIDSIWGKLHSMDEFSAQQ